MIIPNTTRIRPVQSGDEMEWDQKAGCIIITRGNKVLRWQTGPSSEDDKGSFMSMLKTLGDFLRFAWLTSQMLALNYEQVEGRVRPTVLFF